MYTFIIYDNTASHDHALEIDQLIPAGFSFQQQDMIFYIIHKIIGKLCLYLLEKDSEFVTRSQDEKKQQLTALLLDNLTVLRQILETEALARINNDDLKSVIAQMINQDFEGFYISAQTEIIAKETTVSDASIILIKEHANDSRYLERLLNRTLHQNNKNLFLHILPYIDVNLLCPVDFGYTKFMTALRELVPVDALYEKILLEMLKQNPNPTYASQCGMTALSFIANCQLFSHIFTLRNKHPEIAPLLKDEDSLMILRHLCDHIKSHPQYDINANNDQASATQINVGVLQLSSPGKETALSAAIFAGKHLQAQCLQSYGAYIDALVDIKNSRTALHLAAITLRYLLNNPVQNKEEMFRDLGWSFGDAKCDITPYLYKYLEFCENLIAYGASLKIPDKFGNTPWHYLNNGGDVLEQAREKIGIETMRKEALDSIRGKHSVFFPLQNREISGRLHSNATAASLLHR